MARAAPSLSELAATGWGRAVARYSRAVLANGEADIVLEAPTPLAPVVWIGWHEVNLLTLSFHCRYFPRPAIAFVPPGLAGAAMRGWLEELGIEPVALAPDARRGLGLRQMRAALAAGKDALIAVDGPLGPRHRVAPGAFWLARASGAEVRPVGSAASRYVRLPRWDRMLVPLPGAHVTLVVGRAWRYRHDTDLGARLELAAELHRLMASAKSVAGAVSAPVEKKEVVPWP
jgi:lysophospholipid acyltransferase (LPLAT)-like uncharacterized protein